MSNKLGKTVVRNKNMASIPVSLVSYMLIIYLTVFYATKYCQWCYGGIVFIMQLNCYVILKLIIQYLKLIIQYLKSLNV